MGPNTKLYGMPEITLFEEDGIGPAQDSGFLCLNTRALSSYSSLIFC